MAEKSSKRSEIWNFFQIAEDGDKTKCNLCDVLISYKNSSTKGMWDHIKCRHPLEKADENKSVKQKFGSVMKQTKLNFGEKFSRDKHEICYRASAEVCAADLRPFGMFSTAAYRRYMSKVQPAYSTPVATTVKKYLKLEYLNEKTKLQAELKEQEAVALTSDFWRSAFKQSYITVTAHYIDINWIMKHPILATRRVKDQHTGQIINSVLNDIRKEFNIHEKVAGLTTDNASNMKKAGYMQSFNTCTDATVSCMAHTLQLAVHDGLEIDEIKKAAAEARNCVGYFNRSENAGVALEEYQKRQDPQKRPLTVIQDVATRWNSLYMMFERLVHLRSAIYAVLHDKKFTKPSECESHEISTSTWNLIEELLPVLKPMVDATEALSSEKYPSVSCIVPMIVGLIKYNLASKEDDSELVENFKVKVIIGLRSRFKMPDDDGFTQSVTTASMLLDPRHKSLAAIEDPCIRKQVKNFVLDMIKVQGPPEARKNDQEPSPSKKLKTVSSYLEGYFSDEEDTTDTIEEELNTYIQEKVTRRSTKDPLLWWKVNEAKFPNVAKLARKMLCIMGTSVPSERVFSIAGLTVTNKRSQIDPESVDQIIFMNKAVKRRYDEEGKNTKDIPFIKEEPSAENSQGPNMDFNDEDPPLPELY